MLATPADLSALEWARIVNVENAKARAEGFKSPQAGSNKVPATPKQKPKAPVNLSRPVRNEEAMQKTGKLGKTGEVTVSGVFCFIRLFLTCVFQAISCNMCVSRKDPCVYGSRVACQTCNQRKVR
jgi:hypothetical protein